MPESPTDGDERTRFLQPSPRTPAIEERAEPDGVSLCDGPLIVSVARRVQPAHPTSRGARRLVRKWSPSKTLDPAKRGGRIHGAAGINSHSVTLCTINGRECR